jgi:DNA-binding protein Fis
MQKIVAFVSPVRAAKTQNKGNGVGSIAESVSVEGGEGMPSTPAGGSEVKIEAMLSDGQARRILESLIEREPCSETDCLIDDFLELGIELAGPDASDLYERIVLAVERRLISRVYEECGQVKTKAAARLGINRNTLDKRLKQHLLICTPGTDVSTIDNYTSRLTGDCP